MIYNPATTGSSTQASLEERWQLENDSDSELLTQMDFRETPRHASSLGTDLDLGFVQESLRSCSSTVSDSRSVPPQAASQPECPGQCNCDASNIVFPSQAIISLVLSRSASANLSYLGLCKNSRLYNLMFILQHLTTQNYFVQMKI